MLATASLIAQVAWGDWKAWLKKDACALSVNPNRTQNTIVADPITRQTCNGFLRTYCIVSPEYKFTRAWICSLSQKNESEFTWAEICKKFLKIDKNTAKEIVALEHVFDNSGSALEKRWNIFNAIDIFPDVIKSQFLKQNTESEPFIKRRYPHTYKELNINGHRLMSEFGLRNEQISQAYKNMLLAVFTDKVRFENTDELLKYIKWDISLSLLYFL